MVAWDEDGRRRRCCVVVVASSIKERELRERNAHGDVAHTYVRPFRQKHIIIRPRKTQRRRRNRNRPRLISPLFTVVYLSSKL